MTSSPARQALVLGLVAVMLAGLWAGWVRDRAPAPQEALAPPPVAATEQAAVTAPAPLPEAPPAQAEVAVPEVPPLPETPETPGAPAFDVVRVAPDGNSLVAGRAAPGARVTIYAGARPVAEAEADAAGDFVALFETEPGPGAQALTLDATDADGQVTASEDVVVILPVPETAPAAEPAPLDTEAPEPEQPAPLATALLREGRVEVTFSDADAGLPGLMLASISYGETGLVRLDGRAAPRDRVRSYVDDRFAREAVPDSDGLWSLELPDLAQGVYRLRIDAIRPDGSVSARVETPFQRDLPVLAEGDAEPEAAGRPTAVIVQPGNSLWALARIHYGAGVRYTQIYTANKDLIRDPELIYPGQIFTLPQDQAPVVE